MSHTPGPWEIIYPESRQVSADTIRSWYLDALANGEVDDCEGAQISEMADALDSAGIITLSKDQLWDDDDKVTA